MPAIASLDGLAIGTSLELTTQRGERIIATGVPGGGPLTAYGADLVGSQATLQWIASISGQGGGGGTVPINATSLSFAANQVAASLTQAQAIADVVPTLLFIQAQGAFGGAAVNTTGGVLALFSGDSQTGAGHAGFLVQGGTNAAPTIAQIQMRSSGIGGVPNDPTVVHVPWAWTETTVAVTSGASNPFTLAQSACPVLRLTGVLSGAGTVIQFPNVRGFWLLDISGMSGFSAVNTLSFQSGSQTVVVINTALVPGQGDELILVLTSGANTIRTMGSTVSPL